MSVTQELQEHLRNLLKDDPAVSALINGIFDEVPADPFGKLNAYVTFGSLDCTPNDAECITSDVITQQIDVWTRMGGRKKCGVICDAIKKLLHDNETPLTINALALMKVTLFQIIKDIDGKTMHGIIQVSATVEER